MPVYGPIESLRLSIDGMLKEHPDLKGKEESEIRQESIKRFKEKINKMASEEEIAKYIIKELRGVGYTPKLLQKDGFRPVPLK